MDKQSGLTLRRCAVVAIGITFVLAEQAMARQRQASVTPEQDNFIWRMQPDTVQNYLGDLVIKGETDTYIRKGYMKFMLPQGTQVMDASISITFRRDGGTVGSHRFEIYAITDSGLDDWTESTITWNNAPANVSNGNTFDPNVTRFLGGFSVPQGTPSGTTFVVQSAELRESINADPNGVLSLLLRRSTRDAQAHTFFSSDTGEVGVSTPALVLTLDRPWIAVTPTCPIGGPIVISWIAMTPNEQAALLFSRSDGMFEMPRGNPCEGVVLGLSSNGLRLVFRGNGGSDGARTLHGNVGSQACGGYMQLLDLGDCSTSNVVRIQ